MPRLVWLIKMQKVSFRVPEENVVDKVKTSESTERTR